MYRISSIDAQNFPRISLIHLFETPFLMPFIIYIESDRFLAYTIAIIHCANIPFTPYTALIDVQF